MTPQWNFMVDAPIRLDRMGALGSLLASMTDPPGMAKSDGIFPFKQFDTLHYARFVILHDQTVDDFKEVGERIPVYDPILAFFGDCDEPGDAFLAKAAEGRAGDGLCEIFSHCVDPPSKSNLLAWMKTRSLRPAAAYVNYLGRTVRQIQQEDRLRDAVIGYLKANPPATDNPQATRRGVIDFVSGSDLALPVEAATPSAWRVWNLIDLLIPFAALAIRSS